MVAHLSGSDEEWGAPSRRHAGGGSGSGARGLSTTGGAKKRRKKDDYDSCIVCSRPGAASRIIDCYSCGTIYHLHCLRPPMTERPEDPQWWCPLCTEDFAQDLVCAKCRVRTGPFVQDADTVLCKKCFDSKADPAELPPAPEDSDADLLKAAPRDVEAETHLQAFLQEEISQQEPLTAAQQQALLHKTQDPVSGPLPLPTASFDLHIHDGEAALSPGSSVPQSHFTTYFSLFVSRPGVFGCNRPRSARHGQRLRGTAALYGLIEPESFPAGGICPGAERGGVLDAD